MVSNGEIVTLAATEMNEQLKATPKKITERLPASISHSFCLICVKNIDEFYKQPKDSKILLWSNDGKKSIAGQNAELYLGAVLGETDFKVVCKACYRSIQTALKNKSEKQNTFLEGRRTSALKYIRRQTKREVPTDACDSSEPKRQECAPLKSRRKLLEDFGNDLPFSGCEVPTVSAPCIDEVKVRFQHTYFL